LEKNLLANEQSLIFLNRRGTARLVNCQNCGWQALCPRCDVPFTYHHDRHQLRCHICGLVETPPTSCPDCASTDISYQKRGTKSLADELSRLFPEARIKRFDSDNLTEERLEHHYADIA